MGCTTLDSGSGATGMGGPTQNGTWTNLGYAPQQASPGQPGALGTATGGTAGGCGLCGQ